MFKSKYIYSPDEQTTTRERRLHARWDVDGDDAYAVIYCDSKELNRVVFFGQHAVEQAQEYIKKFNDVWVAVEMAVEALNG